MGDAVHDDDAQGGAPIVAAVVFVFSDGAAGGRASTASVEALASTVDLETRVRTVVAADDDVVARNRAIDKEPGTYIAVVDAGVVVPPEWLAISIATLRDDPTLGMVVPDPVASADPGGWLIDPDPTVMVMRRSAWAACGGFDPGLRGGARGLDLGWRMWVQGWRVRAIDLDIATPVQPDPTPAELTAIAARVLRHPGSLATPARRRRGPRSLRRDALQRQRRRSDAELGVLVERSMARSRDGNGRTPGLGPVLTAAGATEFLGPRRRVIVATADTLAPRMAGPGIRALRIATALATDHDVHLVTTGACSLPADGFPIESVDHDRFRSLADDADVLVFQGWILADRPWLVESDLTLVADIYDPMHLEQLEQGREAPAEGGRWEAIRGATDVLNRQLQRGDYFLCASHKQRDFWLGQLAGVGRVNQVLYDEDNALEDRLRIVPFGIEDEPPVGRGGAIRGAIDGIADGDEIVLWGGGIYNWFDPVTLIHAIDRLRRRRPTLRLFFLGTRHPNPEIPEMRMAVEARRLAESLDLVGSHVFFNDGWVAFDERADYLVDADVAVSIHQRHIETEFSFRTRLLDYLWCGLPIVATEGDSFAPVIEANELGEVVPAGDIDALAAALDALLGDDERRAAVGDNSAALAEDMRWATVLEPLLEICRAPVRAPDITCPDTAMWFGVGGPMPAWREDLALARRYLSEGGLTMVVGRLRSRFDRLRRARQSEPPPTG